MSKKPFKQIVGPHLVPVPETYTTQDVAHSLGVCAATVRRLWRDGELDGKLVGNKLRFTRDAVMRYMAGA